MGEEKVIEINICVIPPRYLDSRLIVTIKMAIIKPITHRVDVHVLVGKVALRF